MTDLSSAAAWLLHAMEVHAWRACLAHGGDARAVRYTVGTWDRGVKTDYPPAPSVPNHLADDSEPRLKRSVRRMHPGSPTLWPRSAPRR